MERRAGIKRPSAYRKRRRRRRRTGNNKNTQTLALCITRLH
jgi:hypothetical protein